MDIIYTEYNENDFEGYRDCLESFYHGTHPYPEYLQKEFISRLLKSGNLIVTLAKTDDGYVVGTAIAQLLDGVFENSVMLGMRYVREAYQGNGIGRRQETYLLGLVNERFPNARSIYADVVMNNKTSQRTLSENNFVLCGINMMFFREPAYKSKFKEDDYKLTMSIFAKAVKKKDVVIYAPEKYYPLLEEIYNSLGIKAENYPGRTTDTEKTEFTYKILEKHNTSEFFVTLPGKDSNLLSDEINKRLNAGDTISVYINVSVPGGEALAEKLEKNNFMFFGAKPLNEKAEYILMCNIKNHEGDLRNVQIPDRCKKAASHIIGGLQ